MNPKLLSRVEKYIQDIIMTHYKNKTINIFDEFVKMCQVYYDKPAHNLSELKLKNNTKLKGDIFEHFAYKYFKVCYPDVRDVWLLKDVPDDIKQKLSLKASDLGIDLIAQDNKGTFHAIQAKYRKKGYKLNTGLSWKTLATFYALCNRTGPYNRHIIITNCEYVRHIGKKTKQDQSICIGTLRNITIDNWLKIAGLQGCSLNNTPTNPQKKIIIRKKIEVNNEGNIKDDEDTSEKIDCRNVDKPDMITMSDNSLTKKKLIIKKKPLDQPQIQQPQAHQPQIQQQEIQQQLIHQQEVHQPQIHPPKSIKEIQEEAKLNRLNVLRQQRIAYYEKTFNSDV